MARIVEIYPDIESVKEQVEVRELFGWESSVEITDRGVYQVTFTRNDNTARNRKLKSLEDDFNECASAQDYVDRYNEVHVNKSKFKAMGVFAWIVAIYFMIQFAFGGIAGIAINYLCKTQPEMIFSQMTFTDPSGNTVEIHENWSQEINLEEIGLYGILSAFGVEEKTFTLNTDFLAKAILVYGIGSLILFILLLGWVIGRKRKAKLYYKAEVDYVENRKYLLNGKVDYLENRIDEIINEVAKAQ